MHYYFHRFPFFLLSSENKYTYSHSLCEAALCAEFIKICSVLFRFKIFFLWSLHFKNPNSVCMRIGITHSNTFCFHLLFCFAAQVLNALHLFVILYFVECRLRLCVIFHVLFKLFIYLLKTNPSTV